jgi:hypothetical protein
MRIFSAIRDTLGGGIRVARHDESPEEAKMAPRTAIRNENRNASDGRSPDSGGALKMPSGEILRNEINEGMDALNRPTGGLFGSGLSAGLEIGFSVILMAVVVTHAKEALPANRRGGVRRGHQVRPRATRGAGVVIRGQKSAARYTRNGYSDL